MILGVNEEQLKDQLEKAVQHYRFYCLVWYILTTACFLVFVYSFFAGYPSVVLYLCLLAYVVSFLALALFMKRLDMAKLELKRCK